MSRNPRTCKKIARKPPSIEVEVLRFLLDRISDKDWGIDTRTRRDRNKPGVSARK